MVGTEISHIGEMMSHAGEHFRGDSILLGNGLPIVLMQRRDHAGESAEGHYFGGCPDGQIRILGILAAEVVDEKLSRSCCLFVELAEPGGMRRVEVEAIVKIRRQRMAERAVFPSEGMSDGGTEVNFDEFKRFGKQVSELGVERVGEFHLLEGHAFWKGMSRLFEGKAVTREAVVVNVSQKGFGVLAVIHLQAASFQLGDLIGDRKPGFGVRHFGGRPTTHGEASGAGEMRSRQRIKKPAQDAHHRRAGEARQVC